MASSSPSSTLRIFREAGVDSKRAGAWPDPIGGRCDTHARSPPIFLSSLAMESLVLYGTELRRGTRVRLRPRGPGDSLDLALAGKTATVDAIEQDCEGHVHFAVLLEGRRLFFDPAEIDLI